MKLRDMLLLIVSCLILGACGTMLVQELCASEDDTPVPVVSVRHGELPVGVPVMLYWVGPDGRVTGESAVRTDFAGVLPYSTTTDRVAYFQFSGWTSWTPLKDVMVEP